MSTPPFASYSPPRPSPWGYGWAAKDVFSSPRTHSAQSTRSSDSASPTMDPQPNQLVNMPAALISSLKREKKPFTYTPGGVNLSEVLNARLQKRLERKKRQSHVSPERIERLKQVIVEPTYNSPIDMYSMENAIEALEVQAELATEKTPAAPCKSATFPRNHTFRFEEQDFDSNRNVVQSKAFRVLQIITDTEVESQLKGFPLIPKQITSPQMKTPQFGAEPADSSNPPFLKRPAAFLPMNTNKIYYDPAVGTDF